MLALIIVTYFSLLFQASYSYVVLKNVDFDIIDNMSIFKCNDGREISYHGAEKGNIILSKTDQKISLNDVFGAFLKSWSKETTAPACADIYDVNINPSLGQCTISSLIINDYFGGKIFRVKTTEGMHCYNVIDSIVVDLTSDQFTSRGLEVKYENGSEISRDFCLEDENTIQRYNKLKKLVEINL